MDQRRHVSLQKSAKPSKFYALIALIIAVLLPYVLIKGFRPKQSDYTNKTLSLPKIIAKKPKSTAPEVTDNKAVKNEQEWQIITTKDGDTLASIFKRCGLSQQTLHNILKNNANAKSLTVIKPNQKLQLLIRDQQLEKLIFPLTITQSLVVTRKDSQFKTEITNRKTSSHNHYVTATVRGSLYSTAKNMNIPAKLIRQMTEIFNWEIDFSKDVRAGDRFTIIYKAFFIENKLVGTGEIIAVSYTNRGKTFSAIRHKNKNGEYEYFTPEGNSLKKAFSRYPLKFSHISSTFSLSRMHPILHRRRPHKGVDLAAPIGTPIRAVGDGKIAIIGRQSGYGNMIKIIHNKTYSTVYAHMLKFQKELVQGDRVKRGQIIGYVGQTGLATGPHCHYEVHINHQPKNPTTVELPRSSPVPARELASFKSTASTLLAQMRLFEEAQFASGQNVMHG